VLQRDLAALEIRTGRILSDVELAHLAGAPLHEAVHAHEAYPHLARAHGLLRDALLKNVPGELVPLARSVLSRPPPDWAAEFRDDLCIVARSTEASSAERALCRLLIFEGIWLNLFIAARRTNGRFEGAGAGGRDIERAAGETLAHLLAVPLDEDASGDFRAFQVTLAAAMARLHEYVQTAWCAQLQHFAALDRVDEIHDIFEMRVNAEMLIRRASPAVEALLRNELESERALHLQPIPVARLPLEHPLILGDLTEGTLNKRSSRARKDLAANPKALACRKTTLADLFANLENVDA
jgi:hypothetical protein